MFTLNWEGLILDLGKVITVNKMLERLLTIFIS